MLPVLYVAAGGAFGSVLRYLLSNVILRIMGPGTFPYGTFVVNVFGSFAMGLWIGAMTYFLPERARDMHLLIAVGVLGGFTTFSTFSLDLYTLVQKELLLQAGIYVGGSMLLSLAGLAFGLWIMRLATA